MAVDVETTGLDFESETVIELAAVRFEGGVPAGEFQALLQPGKPLTAMARLLTGLDAQTLAGAPPAAESLRAFLDFAGALPLVAHNADFDSGFVGRALDREGLPRPPGPWLDSLLLARTAWPRWESHRLEILAARLGLPEESAHRALPDARRAGLLFLAAQAALRAAPPAVRAALAALSRELPWRAVFSEAFAAGATGDGAGNAPPSQASAPASANVPAQAEPVPLENAAPGERPVLPHAGWRLLETAPQDDETVLAWTLARAGAAQGRRILLALPGGPLLAGPDAAALHEPEGYLCRRRLDALLADSDRRLPPEERAALLPVAAWALQGGGGAIAACRAFSPDRQRLLWSRLCCDAYEDDPEAKAARVAAENSRVLVVSHAGLLSHLRLEGSLFPGRDALIVAGAHRLPESARRRFGAEATFFRLRRLVQVLRFSEERPFGLCAALPPEPAAAALPALAEEAERRFQRLLQKLGKQAAKRRERGDTRIRYREPLALAFGVDPEPALSALRELEAALAALAPTASTTSTSSDWGSESARLLSRLRAFRLDLERLFAARGEEATWLEDFSNPHKAALRSVPLDLTARCGEPLRELFPAGVFLSPALATASDGGRFFLRSLGLGSAPPPLRRPDPAPPHFFLAPFTPVQAALESAEAFAEFLAETAGPFSEHGVFVLFPAPGALKVAHRVLSRKGGFPVWGQHCDGGPDALERLFASAPGGFVLATEGLEGLRDARGRPPALAAVARMPLPSRREPIWEARAENLGGKSPWTELWHPAAVLRLKLDLSRLRRADGARVVWLLDARASSENLGPLAARSLGCEPATAADAEDLRRRTREALGAIF